ncbi:Uncharacterised protein [Klebsiella michiganensis]|jgi:hypothetical protein|nr:Uncharacterised protein [Klebsiella michiganensis]SLS76217.1 Uncharacterised protein [Klebsiella pneumoniae]
MFMLTNIRLEQKDMDKKTLAEWLRDIAHHIEEESPLIRDVRLDDAISEEGLARKIVTITFNAHGQVLLPERDVSGITRH